MRGRALKSESLRVGSGVADWAPPCAAVAGLQGTTPSPEGGSLAVKIRTGVKKTPLFLNQTLKSPVRIGKRSVPRRFKSWNMALRQVMWQAKGWDPPKKLTWAHNSAHFKGE